MKALALAALLAAPAHAAPGSLAFAVDPRVEALSVVLMLADPEGFKGRRPAGPDAYASAAEAAFAGFSGHPAVASARALLAGGALPSALARAALTPAAGDAFAAELRDFQEASRFAEFFSARGADHAAYVETARRESRRALSPEAALAYMGVRFEGERRFILAPLLPDDEGADGLRLRPGIPEENATRFGFDSFERSAASLLCREAASWLDAPAGSVPEHLAAAVGLRVLAADLGEPVYRAALRRHVSRRLPRLERLAEDLKGYEADRRRYPVLSAYSSRLSGAAALRVDQAEAAAREGRRGEALALLAGARAHGPDVETGRRLIFLYQDLGEAARAEEAAEELHRAAPGDPGATLERAGAAAKAGDRAGALALLAGAPGRADASVRRRMAGLYAELEAYGPARELLDGLAAESPRDARLLLDRALANARGGDRPAARRDLAAAAALEPGSGEVRRAAFLHLELGDHARAGALFDRLIRESPGDARLRADAAVAAAEGGRREKALSFLDEARERSPDEETLRRVAALYLQLDDDERARRVLRDLPPLDARLEIDLAARAARAGDKAAALRRLESARPLSPSFEERRLMVTLYRSLDEPAPARELLAGLLLAAPRDAGLRVELAALASRAGERAAALSALAEARALSPGPEDRRRMALLHQDLKDYAPAAALLEALVRERPRDASLRGDLGLCRYLEGRADAAIEELRAAIALDPASLQAVVTLGSIYASRERFDLERALYAAAPASGGDPALRALLRGRRAELARAAKP